MDDFSPGLKMTLEHQAAKRGVSVDVYVRWLDCRGAAVREGLSGPAADRRADELLAARS